MNANSTRNDTKVRMLSHKMRTLPFKRFQRYLQCDEAESFSGVLPAANGFAIPEEHTTANMVEVASQEDKGRKPTSEEVLL